MTLSDITNICDRNYFLSYLTPSIIFIISTFSFVKVLFPQIIGSDLTYQESFSGLIIAIYKEFQNLWISDFIVLTLGAWVVSVILMISNLQLTQILEGYKLIPKNYFTKRQQKKFDALDSEIRKITNVMISYNKLKDNEKTLEKIIELINIFGLERGALGVKDNELLTLTIDEIYQILAHKRMILTLKLRTEFPYKRSQILPTSFGNIIRSFEFYSLHVYGVDAVAVWPRIVQLASEDHKKSINDLKAQVDFSINLYYVLILLLLEYFGFSIITRSNPSVLIPIMILLFSWSIYTMLLASTKAWGEEVKSVFDLYRDDLMKKIKGCYIKGSEKEKWQKLNWLYLYWEPLEKDK